MLAIIKLNTIKVLDSRALINSDISHDEFKIERLQQFIRDFNLFIKQSCHNVGSVDKIQKVKQKARSEKTNKRNLMLFSRCMVCNSKKLRFITEQKTGLLTSLGLKTFLF